MAEWPAILVPAMLVALMTRLDAKMVGPYFALSAVIAAGEGLWCAGWYSDRKRLMALLRRFAYPCIAGFLSAWCGLRLGDGAAIGAVSATLLIWPAFFGGLPWFVPRSTWHLPALYLTFIAACGFASLAGFSLQRMVISFAAGDVVGWAAEQVTSTVLFWLATVLLVLLFKTIFRATGNEAERRERQGAEGN